MIRALAFALALLVPSTALAQLGLPTVIIGTASEILANGQVGTANPQPGAVTLTLDPSIAAWGGFDTNGILAQTSSGVFAGRTLTGTANQITVSNGNGVAGNPTFSAPQNIDTGASVQFARVGVGVVPTALLHFAAGTTTAGTAPAKFTSGPLTTVAVAGQAEFLTDAFYLSGTTGPTRKAIADYRYRGETAGGTLTGADEFVNVTSGTHTQTLPTAVGYTKEYTIKNSGTGVVTIATTGGQTIDGFPSEVLGIQYESASVRSDGSNWFITKAYKFPPAAHAEYLDTTTQAIASATTAQIVTFNTTTHQQGVTLSTGTGSVANSRFVFGDPGSYSIQVSAIADISAGAHSLELWLRTATVGNTPADVANSNTVQNMTGTVTGLIGVTFHFDAVTIGDMAELWISGDSTNSQMLAIAAETSPTRPATPSIIVTINKVSE